MTRTSEFVLLAVSGDREELYRSAKERASEFGVLWEDVNECNLRLDVVHTKDGYDTYRLWLKRRVTNPEPSVGRQ